MKLLFGTGNKAKLNVMKIRLKPLGIDLIGLEDLKKEGYTVPSVSETGNARVASSLYIKQRNRKLIRDGQNFHIAVDMLDSDAVTIQHRQPFFYNTCK